MMFHLVPFWLRLLQQVVVGEITGIKTRWVKEQEPIYSEITVAVKETWKGDASVKSLTFDQIGGVFGDMELTVPDAVPFKVGETVILFIDRDEDFTDLAGWFQGKFNIEGTVAVQSKTGRRIPIHELKNIVIQHP